MPIGNLPLNPDVADTVEPKAALKYNKHYIGLEVKAAVAAAAELVVAELAAVQLAAVQPAEVQPAEVRPAVVRPGVVRQEQARAQPARRPVRADQPAQMGRAPVAEGVHRDQEPEELIRACQTA